MIAGEHKHSYHLKETWYQLLAHMSSAGSNNLLFIIVVLKGCEISRTWEISPSPLPLSYPDSAIYFVRPQNCLKSWDKEVITAFIASRRENKKKLCYFCQCYSYSVPSTFPIQSCFLWRNLILVAITHANLHRYTYTAQGKHFFLPIPTVLANLPSPELFKQRFQQTPCCALMETNRKNTALLKGESPRQECLGSVLSVTWGLRQLQRYPLNTAKTWQMVTKSSPAAVFEWKHISRL